jgi:putative membrane protein
MEINLGIKFPEMDEDCGIQWLIFNSMDWYKSFSRVNISYYIQLQILKSIIMKKLLVLAMFSVLALSACDTKKAEDSKEVAEEQNEAKFDSTDTDDDAEMAVEYADGGMLEVKLGELAQTNAAAASVKDFGMMMTKDHGEANSEFEKIAEKHNISLPTVLSEDSQKMYDKLSGLKGADFDKEYVNGMVDAHEKTLENLKEQVEEGKNQDLKDFASKKIPTVEKHLSAVKAIKEKM